jgi:threonyl-tRNA synthetase
LRHDTAHLLAHAIKELYPDCQITIGPVIEGGCYYDIAPSVPLTPDDFPAIEAKMREIIRRGLPIVRELWDRDEAIAWFSSIGEHYKAEIIRDIPGGEAITLYRQGDFVDLCRGPHGPTTSVPKAFKITSLAGAYWRGDSRNVMLQRLYVTVWPTQEALDAHLERLEEAKRRDHRRLAKEMDLFHFQEEAPGMVFWHPHGWTMVRLLEDYIRRKIASRGYVEVKTPLLVDLALWEASGHWEKFGEQMFTSESEARIMALKPMNCPCHVELYKQRLHSYRDLPLRMAEFGVCHRNEASGALHGLLRVRSFTQDDAHIFCTPEQVLSEAVAFCALLQEVYRELGFTEVHVKFSDRPERRAGTDAVWDQAELALRGAIEATGLPYAMNPGEGAFYGPKLEFHLRDAIGRDWQCGTLQLDFVLPERLDASYIGADGAKHRPVMLHRAILGTIERFLGILLEQYVGRVPLWLAPVQAVVLTITDAATDYAHRVVAEARAAGLRCEMDVSSEKIGYKVRHWSLTKAPMLWIVGKQEAEAGEVSVRFLGSDRSETVLLPDLIARSLREAMPPDVRACSY